MIEDLRPSLFSQPWGIDAGTFTTTIGNSTLTVQNLDSEGCKTFGSSKRPFLDFNWDSKGVVMVKA